VQLNIVFGIVDLRCSILQVDTLFRHWSLISSSYARTMGANIGTNWTNLLTDQEYAGDAILFTDCPFKWPDILASYESATETMGLHTSRPKTKVQNIGCA